MRPIIGAQLFTLRDYLTTPKDIAETFQKVRKMGYTAAQFSGAPIGDAKELRKMADDAGLSLICTHIPFDDMKNNLSKVVEDHHTLGCTHAGVGAMPNENRTSAEGFLSFAKELDGIAKQLKAEGLGTTYHNHQFEFERFDGKIGMDILLDNSECFSVMADTYWIQYGGGDVVAWLKKMEGRLDLVHLKDYAIVNHEPAMAEVMEGNLNWQAILDECERQGIKYAFVEQDVCRRDPFDCLQTSLENLKTIL